MFGKQLLFAVLLSVVGLLAISCQTAGKSKKSASGTNGRHGYPFGSDESVTRKAFGG